MYFTLPYPAVPSPGCKSLIPRRGCIKSPLCTLVQALVFFVLKIKALKHKGSQSASQSDTKVMYSKNGLLIQSRG